MRGEILGLERRRFWHDDDKLEIGVDGASVTQVAPRHEIGRHLETRSSPQGGASELDIYGTQLTEERSQPLAELSRSEMSEGPIHFAVVAFLQPRAPKRRGRSEEL